MELVLATRNEDKIREIREALKGLDLKILTFKDFPHFPTVEEKGKTLKENALLKARTVAKVVGKLSLADDSGIEVEALDGAPGVFSSRFAGENVSYEDNNRKLLLLLKDVPEEKRKALFRCVMVLATPEGKELIVEGICPGKITKEPRGKEGFGYDPVFQPKGLDKTFAELSLQEKNKISHRAIALREIRKKIEKMVQVKDKFLIGLTGNMGCGKSTVADFFKKWGIRIIEADKVGHRVLEREDVKRNLLKIFGDKILDSKGKISRKRIRREISLDRKKMKELNQILHPVIEEEIWKIITNENFKLAVIEAALIFEAGWDFFMDRIIVVHCSKKKQIERIKKSTDFTLDEINTFLEAQLPQEEKIKRADFAIENEGDLVELEKKAKQVLNKILAEIKSYES